MSAVEPVRATPGSPGGAAPTPAISERVIPELVTSGAALIAPTLSATAVSTVERFAPEHPASDREIPTVTESWLGIVAEPFVGVLARVRLRYVGMAAITVGAIMVTLVAPLVHVRPGIHELALLGHLIALAVGFGAVLAVDWFGLLWMLRRRPLTAVLQVAHGLHTLIWIGLFGLVATGCLLSPHLSSPLTRIKLTAVLIVAVNGLFVDRLQNRLAAIGDGKPTGPLLMRAAVTALVSQLCWWTAIIVGFLNTQA